MKGDRTQLRYLSAVSFFSELFASKARYFCNEKSVTFVRIRQNYQFLRVDVGQFFMVEYRCRCYGTV